MSFSDELPNPTADFQDNKEWRTRLKSGANRLSTDLFKMKHQYYDRRQSSMDSSTWYSTGTSISTASAMGNAAASANMNYTYSSGGTGLLQQKSLMADDEDDRDEVTYSPARLSLIAGIPSPASGLGPSDKIDSWDYGNDSMYAPLAQISEEDDSLQQRLVEALSGYESQYGTEPLAAEDAALSAADTLPPGAKSANHTSLYRSFEGWGFDADELQKMDPTIQKENRPPTNRMAKPAVDRNLSMVDVDPLDFLDKTRSHTENHSLAVPGNPGRKRSSAIYLREQQRKRRISSLQSLSASNSRPTSGQYANPAKPSISRGVNGGYTSSPYRPSIVISELGMFDLSESEPPTRPTSINLGALGKQSISNSRNSSLGSHTSEGHEHGPVSQKVRKSIFSFFSGKMRTKRDSVGPKSYIQTSDGHFIPLLHDITETSSISSREPTPEIMTAKKAPMLKFQQKNVDGIKRIVPVRPDFQMRRASVSLQLEDEDIFDAPAPKGPSAGGLPSRDRRNSSVYSQRDLLPLRTRRSSSVYEDSAIQPGEEDSPPSSPSLTRRYSMTHVSHPEIYIPPRANWYKSDWGLDINKKLDSDARSITSHGYGAVKIVLSRHGSRRGSMDMVTPDGLRKLSADERMEDLSKALREALKLNEIPGILEEDDEY